MAIDYQIFVDRQVIVAEATGPINLSRSKRAIQAISSDPQYSEGFEVLIDLRQVTGHLGIAGVFELATALERPNSLLPTYRKVALVVADGRTFDEAEFLELCAQNRGVNIRWFTSRTAAQAWLEAEVPQV